MASEVELVEFRCPNDDKLLLKVSDVAGIALEVKCSRCGEIVKAERQAESEE